MSYLLYYQTNVVSYALSITEGKVKTVVSPKSNGISTGKKNILKKVKLCALNAFPLFHCAAEISLKPNNFM